MNNEMNMIHPQDTQVEMNPVPSMIPPMEIIDIWEDNFFEEMERIMALIPIYNQIAMDTEFPGVVDVPKSMTDDYQYQLVKKNVDDLKMIQLGITLLDENGQLPPGTIAWQFNFRFDVDTEKSAKSSMNVLREAGINFEKHKNEGIDHNTFSEYFITSGLIFNEDVTWICFHGAFDFGYMYKTIANSLLPDHENMFLAYIENYFPKMYDIKYMKHEFDELKGGLSRLGDCLMIERIGPQHQAGSDSLLTGLAFFKLKEQYFPTIDIEPEFNNVLFGLGKSINDEAYLEIYTSMTEDYERKELENQHLEEEYANGHMYAQSQYPDYYSLSNDTMDFHQEHLAPQHMYQNPIYHPSPHHNPTHMYGPAGSPNLPPQYPMSPNTMEYPHPTTGAKWQ